MNSENYEFSASQNELIGDLSRKMNFVGMLAIVLGIISLVFGVIGFIVLLGRGDAGQAGGQLISNIIQGAFALLVGLWTRNAGTAFQRIVDTTGADMENLMGALGELRKLYTLQYWLVLIAVVFMLLALVIGLVTGIATM